MKKIFKLGLLTLTCIVLITGCGKEQTNDEKTNNNNNNKVEEVKQNTNKDVIKDQNLENFKFENVSLTYKNGNSKFVTKVTNTGNTTETLLKFNIIVKDKSGNVIITLPGFIGDSLEAGETKTISTTYGDDLTSKATSIEYEVVR